MRSTIFQASFAEKWDHPPEAVSLIGSTESRSLCFEISTNFSLIEGCSATDSKWDKNSKGSKVEGDNFNSIDTALATRNAPSIAFGLTCVLLIASVTAALNSTSVAFLNAIPIGQILIVPPFAYEPSLNTIEPIKLPMKLGLYRISGSNPVSGCIRPVTGYPAGTEYEQKSGRITVPIVFLYELENNYEKVKTQALFN